MAKILLADDDRAMRFLLSATLQAAGHEILSAEDGPQTLQVTQEFTPDLIIADANMPDFGGVEVLRRLREESNLTPLIILSADPEDHFAPHLEARSRYLAKPVRPPRLLEFVTSFLREISS